MECVGNGPTTLFVLSNSNRRQTVINFPAVKNAITAAKQHADNADRKALFAATAVFEQLADWLEIDATDCEDDGTTSAGMVKIMRARAATLYQMSDLLESCTDLLRD